MEKYFNSLDDLAKWAASNEIGVISIDAHKCLSVNGTVKYGLSCVAKGSSAQKLLHGRFNTNKYSDPKLIDDEATKIESTLRNFGFSVDRMARPV
ncbi:MAG: hypothetical protein AB1489_10210 [Acidobacteriota bacterium]